jgi:hypothetical protein
LNTQKGALLIDDTINPMKFVRSWSVANQQWEAIEQGEVNSVLSGTTAPPAITNQKAGDVYIKKDASGKVVETYSFNGTSYVPTSKAGLRTIQTAQPTPTATGNTTNLNSTFKDASGTTWIVDELGNAISLGSVVTLDGNNYNVVSTNATASVAPTAVEVASPTAGDTATKFLTDNKIEYWAYTTTWNLIKTTNPSTLDGNDTHIARTNTTASVAPTAVEVASPMAGDTAKVNLNNGNTEFWSYNGTAWVLNFTQKSGGDVTYGTTAPTFTAGTTKTNDTYIRTSDGLAPNANASNVIGSYVADGTGWRLVTKNPDYIVSVTGATLPVTFPVTSFAGTPVFAPNLPNDPAVTYRLANGKLATWNGTQYVADNPETSNDYWTNIAGALADGTNDDLEDIKRNGKVGLNVNPLSTFDSNGSLGLARTNVTAATYTLQNTDFVVYANAATSQTLTLPSASASNRRIYCIVNGSPTADTISTYKDISGVSQTSVPSKNALWLQSDGTDWVQINNFNNGINKVRLVQPLAVGNNVITINPPFLTAPSIVQVRDNTTGADIFVRVTAESTTSITINASNAIANARITIIG